MTEKMVCKTINDIFRAESRQVLGLKLLMTKLMALSKKYPDANNADIGLIFARMNSRSINETVRSGAVIVKDPLWLRLAEVKLGKKGQKLHDVHDFFYISFWPGRPKLYKFKTAEGYSWHTF